MHSSTPVHGRTSPNTEIHGGKVSKREFQRRKRTLESRLHTRERRGKNAQPLRAIPQGTSAPPATETATPGSGYTVIQDPAQSPSANHRLFETRMPLLCKTEHESNRIITLQEFPPKGLLTLALVVCNKMHLLLKS